MDKNIDYLKMLRVFIGSESGWEVTLNTITDVGQIHKAVFTLTKDWYKE